MRKWSHKNKPYDITDFHPLAAALVGQRLVKNPQKKKGTLLSVQCNCLQPSSSLQLIKNQVGHSQKKNKKKKHVVMYTTVFGKKSHFLHLSPLFDSFLFMSPSAHFTLSHEVNVVDTVCQLGVLVN